MKKLTFILTLLIFGACSQEELIHKETTTPKETVLTLGKRRGTTTHPLAPYIAPKQLIIRFKNAALEPKKKDSIRERLKTIYSFDINNIETCSCDDKSIELWKITPGPSFGGIEDTVTALSNDDDGEADIEGDYQFWLTVQNNLLHTAPTFDINTRTVAQNNGVNIAVLDTGVAYGLFTERFLYNSSTNNCMNETAGWDFVNDDNDPKDDHGHGTMLTKIITDELYSNSVPFQILPVKVFNESGKGRYFDVLCGLNYIAKKQKNFIVNCSFGFYNLNSKHIFKSIIKNAEDRLLLVSSAGNDSINTSIPGNEHFPSSYNTLVNNVLAVAGHQGTLTSIPDSNTSSVYGLRLASASNFGSNIDVTANFTHTIAFSNLYSPTGSSTSFSQQFSGTSYAAALVTARAATVYHRNRSTSSLPFKLKNNVLNTAFNSTHFNGLINNNKVIIKGFSYNPNNNSSIGANPIVTPMRHVKNFTQN